MRTISFYLTCFLSFAVIIYITSHRIRKREQFSDLPTTPQYFHDFDTKFKTHRFGAISHGDARFSPSEALTIEEVRMSLYCLLQSFTAFTSDKEYGIDIEYWLAHGSLVGWYWNMKQLPWDTDIDLQIAASSIPQLLKYNFTQYDSKIDLLGQEPRRYLLDVNPNIYNTSRSDVANKIDGRWIDISSGRFIDLTIVYRREEDNTAFSKDGHEYKVDQIYPLQSTTFEGFLMKVPHDVKSILEQEYGKKAITNRKFHWHVFDPSSSTWKPE